MRSGYARPNNTPASTSAPVVAGFPTTSSCCSNERCARRTRSSAPRSTAPAPRRSASRRVRTSLSRSRGAPPARIKSRSDSNAARAEASVPDPSSRAFNNMCARRGCAGNSCIARPCGGHLAAIVQRAEPAQAGRARSPAWRQVVRPASAVIPPAYPTPQDRAPMARDPQRRLPARAYAARLRSAPSPQRRKQTPGAVRPARPARCSAEAREMRCTSRRFMPLDGSNKLRRSSPASTTMRTPSMVRLVSAMFVASTILRRPARAGRSAASCSPVRKLAEQRHDVDLLAGVGEHALHAADFSGAGQEHQHVARRFGERAA